MSRLNDFYIEQYLRLYYALKKINTVEVESVDSDDGIYNSSEDSYNENEEGEEMYFSDEEEVEELY